jgi:hypothetical protein
VHQMVVVSVPSGELGSYTYEVAILLSNSVNVTPFFLRMEKISVKLI